MPAPLSSVPLIRSPSLCRSDNSFGGKADLDLANKVRLMLRLLAAGRLLPLFQRGCACRHAGVPTPCGRLRCCALLTCFTRCAATLTFLLLLAFLPARR